MTPIRNVLVVTAAVIIGTAVYLGLPPAEQRTRSTPTTTVVLSPSHEPHERSHPQEAQPEREDIFKLAQSGSSAEIEMLLTHLHQEKSPQRRSHLRTAISSISNPSSAAYLISLLTTVTDEDAILGIQRALSTMADESITNQLANAYESVSEPVVPRITSVVENVLQDSAVPALALMVADPTIPASDQLTAAALRALARLGTPYAAATLARRLDAAMSQEDIDQVSRFLGAINRTGTEAELVAIARGQQDATRSTTRLAALHALRHYPSQQIRAAILLLTTDSDPVIAAQAQAILADGL